jgi:hypothetical protein
MAVREVYRKEGLMHVMCSLGIVKQSCVLW